MQNESWNVESKDGDSSKDTGSAAATPAKWECRNCGAEQKAEDKFCCKCGAPRNQDFQRACPNCGEKQEWWYEHCSTCSAYMWLTKCPHCGTTVKPDARYCGVCGAPLPEEEVSLSGIMSIVSAIATVVMWIVLRDATDARARELLDKLSLIFCCFSVGSCCVALGKGRWSGLIGIVLLFLYAVGSVCGLGNG